ncbi:MAG: rhomboid family intramembrane serine protease [Nitrospirae bacterium]|nr:rhomboid family intramembrane serine protease [Nitrospirota bacterium]
MIPFKDENPTRTFPFFTIAIIALNTLVFFVEVFHPSGMKTLVYEYGAVPRNLLSFRGGQPVPAVLTVFTSMFMHGGLLHIAGNMLYLWIFGNNIEDRLGHFRYLVFYMLSGIVAAYANSLASPSSQIPMIGASGAVSGILGAYLLLYPHARVHTLVFIGFFIQIIRVPALIVIGFWGVIQIINGIVSKGLASQGGVAWFAHIGGFIFGLLTIHLWVPGKRRRE